MSGPPNRTVWESQEDFEHALREFVAKFAPQYFRYNAVKGSFSEVLAALENEARKNDLSVEPPRLESIAIENSAFSDDEWFETVAPSSEPRSESAKFEVVGPKTPTPRSSAPAFIPADVDEALSAIKGARGTRAGAFDRVIDAMEAEEKYFLKGKRRGSAIEALSAFLGVDSFKEDLWPLPARLQLIRPILASLQLEVHALAARIHPTSSGLRRILREYFDRKPDEPNELSLPGTVISATPCIYDGAKEKAERRGTFVCATSENPRLHVLTRFDEARAVLEDRSTRIGEDVFEEFESRLNRQQLEIWCDLRPTSHTDLIEYAQKTSGTANVDLWFEVQALVADFLVFEHKKIGDRELIDASYDRLVKGPGVAIIWPPNLEYFQTLKNRQSVDWNKLFLRLLRALKAGHERLPLEFLVTRFGREFHVIDVRPGCEDPAAKGEWHPRFAPLVTIEGDIDKILDLQSKLLHHLQSTASPQVVTPVERFIAEIKKNSAGLDGALPCAEVLDQLIRLDALLKDHPSRRLLREMRQKTLDAIGSYGGVVAPARELIESNLGLTYPNLDDSLGEHVAELKFENMPSWSAARVPVGRARIVQVGLATERGEMIRSCKLTATAEGKASETLCALDELQLALTSGGTVETESSNQIQKILDYQISQEAEGKQLDRSFFIRLVNRLDELRTNFPSAFQKICDRCVRESLSVLRDEHGVTEKVISQGTVASEIAHEWVERFIDHRPTGAATPGTIIGTKRRVFLDASKKVVQAGVFERARSVGFGGAAG